MTLTRLLIGCGLLLCLDLKAAEDVSSQQVSELLAQAKAQAVVLKSDVDTMDFFAGSTSNWGAHASIVGIYRGHINAIRLLAAKLDEARNAASASQKTTIDRILPLLNEMTSSTEALIDNIDKDPSHLSAGPYQITSEPTPIWPMSSRCWSASLWITRRPRKTWSASQNCSIFHRARRPRPVELWWIVRAGSE